MKNNNVTDYSKILSYGKTRAIPAKELMMIMGFKDARSLRSDIAKARIDGQVILSTPKGEGGYYLPSDDDEVQEFIQIYSHQALSLLRVLKSARQYLSKDDAQLSFMDMIEEWDAEEGACND